MIRRGLRHTSKAAGAALGSGSERRETTRVLTPRSGAAKPVRDSVRIADSGHKTPPGAGSSGRGRAGGGRRGAPEARPQLLQPFDPLRERARLLLDRGRGGDIVPRTRQPRVARGSQDLDDLAV